MKIVKNILKILAILLGIILIVWSVVVSLIATPEVLTPKVVEFAQQHIKSDLSIKSVDLSLFDRFPNITLRVDSLRITQTKDSIDDLLFARRCRVAVNPFALLFKRVVVNFASLEGAKMYIYVDSLNGPLKTFNIDLSDTTNVERPKEETAAAPAEKSDFAISIKRFMIDSTRIIIDDRCKQFYTRVDNFGVNLSTNLSMHQSDLDVQTGFSNIFVWHAGELLVRKTSLAFNSKMVVDMDSLKMSFEKADLRINGINLKSSGSIARDSIANGLLVDVDASLKTQSLTEFLALVPPTIIDNKDKITTQGEVELDLSLDGVYSDSSVPTAQANIKIVDGKAKYASRKLSLESVNCDASLYLDFNTPKESFADIREFRVNTSDILDFNVKGRVTNLIEDPAVDITLHSDIDFNRFSEVFPLNEAVVCKGMNHSDITTRFRLADVQQSNYAKLIINGESTFKDLDLSYDASKFERDSSSVARLSLQAKSGKMIFGDKLRLDSNSRTLRSEMNFSGLSYAAKSGEFLTIKDLELTMGANFNRATSQMNGVGVRGVAKSMRVGIDTLFSADFNNSDVVLAIAPQNDKHNTVVTAKINSREIVASENQFDSKIKLSTADMDLMSKQGDDKDWLLSGEVAFTNFDMFTQLFPLEVKIPDTSVSVNNRTVFLNNAKVQMGSSEFVATGHIKNIIRKLFVAPRESISGELAINASMVNFSELLTASNSSVEMMERMSAETQPNTSTTNDGVADTTSLNAPVVEPTDSLSGVAPVENSMFLVPRRMEFDFDLNIAKALFEDAVIEDVEGRASIRRGCLSLEKLKLMAIGAEATGSLIYRNIDRQSANIAANMDLDGVDINRIGELMPSINSMFPMLKSFEGIVDFTLVANTNIDENFEVDISSLRSAMHFKGRNMVLMDSETFATLSKTLMFKNKKRNLIESLNVYALANKSKVDVLPFEMVIDRYAAIIGGSQVINPKTFDVNYNYNISILKSPLPFKAGVDIEGDLNDFSFDITKAKLKNTNFNAQRERYEAYCHKIAESEALLVQEIEKRQKSERGKRRRGDQQTDSLARESVIEQRDSL